ncbi:hypothetical protein ACTXGW_01635 [Psychrobacter faecalis]|uniref:hypothetical protein n=1 Tax=Psychrobacter faecalis TaxID=180588 RepID=UPI003FD3906A
MRQEYLRAAAEAYANLSELQSDCYHYLNDGFDTAIQARLLAAYSVKLLTKAIPKKYINRIVCTALAECQYPIDEVNGYAWSGNERIAFSGIPKRTWIRNQLSEHVDFILKDMSYNAVAARLKIQLQVDGY